MHQLAPRLDLIAPSPTLTLDAKAKAMKAAGRDIINMGVGEPDFDTPEHIRQAAIKAIEDGFTRYTASDGIIELKEAICAKFQRDNSLNYTPSQIAVSNGGKHSLYNIFLTLFSPGDEVIVPTPCWVSYPPMLLLAGAKPVMVKTDPESGYTLNPEALAAAITPNTRGIILNSPSNPTGMAYSEKQLLALGEMILKHDLWVVSDDIYEKIVFDGFVFKNLPMLDQAFYERTVIAHGLAKTYAMTGWRIGYMAGPEHVARGVAKIQGQTTSNPCSISQKAGLAALNGPQKEVGEMVASFQRRRDLALKMIAEIPEVTCPVPQGAFYLFPDISAYIGRKFEDAVMNSSDDIASYLLEQTGVAMVPGSGFGDGKNLRMSYAVSDEDITSGLVKVKSALLELK